MDNFLSLFFIKTPLLYQYKVKNNKQKEQIYLKYLNTGGGAIAVASALTGANFFAPMSVIAAGLLTNAYMNRKAIKFTYLIISCI